ncbi:hypothetical protein BCR34DRAFT_602955 [Clohesyomyces aquaticus]|uniref:Uncharacterized protein n=1 Tax=Clohesyomyces aquaticus TaxID=1231657 RepID=A0A1Y1ZGC4_9PLEO|nr:hypothetical protein BCR34DRAFT_602955 [Clohesyomyces aquaticus]
MPYTEKDIQEILKKFSELQTHSTPLGQSVSDLRKEYWELDDSLNHYAIQPGAPWGFVVFRTAYGADKMTVIEDPEKLAGADSHTVRHIFRAWVADDLTPRLRDPQWCQLFGGSEQIHSKLASNDLYDADHPVSCLPPRRNFCLFVDEVYLRSLDLPPVRSPAVKILTTD